MVLDIPASQERLKRAALRLFLWPADYVYGLLTKLVRSRWLDIGLVLFCVFLDLDFVSVHKHAKKERGQAWSIKDLLYGIKQQK